VLPWERVENRWRHRPSYDYRTFPVTPPPPPRPPAPIEHQIAHVAMYLECERRERDRALGEAGVLPTHRGARLSHFGATVAEAYTSMLEARTGLFVRGSVGTGKTWLAAAMIAEQIMAAPLTTEEHVLGPPQYSLAQSRSPRHQWGGIPRFPGVEITMTRQLLRRLWSTFRDEASESESQVIRHYTTLDLLVIDDLAHEGKVTEAGVGALHEILSVRLGTYKPTVITSNLSLEEIARVYDAAIASRVGAYERLTLTGEDRRQVAL
jgi:DNA replication protein DnaC